MKTSFAWLPALFLIAAAVCAGESPAPEKPDADAKAKAEEQALQKRVDEVLKVFSSGEEKAIKELQEKLLKDDAIAIKILERALIKEAKDSVGELIVATLKTIIMNRPSLGLELWISRPNKPISVLPPDIGPFELNYENSKLVMDDLYFDIKNNCSVPIVIARPRGGSSTCQEYPYYDVEFFTQEGEKLMSNNKFDIDPRKEFRDTEFIRLGPDEHWGKSAYLDWPRPPKPGKYKMRLRYVMPKAEHRCADEAAKKLADEASIGEVFSNTVDIEFVFPSKEELKKMGVVQDATEEMKKKDEK